MAHPKTRFTDLTLILTERCNLRCGYCYVPKQAREMPLQTALRASDWLLEQAPAGRDLSISFFGGEPLLAEPTLLAIMACLRGRRPRGLRFMTPTNATLLDAERLERLRAAGLELALSIDEAAGGSSKGKSLDALGETLPELRRLAPIVRMTVTPENVGGLFETVVALFGAGFHRIMHQPALEQPWPAEALEAWRSEHARLGAWLAERYQARQPIPDLITLEGISRRLSGTPARYCGAGVTTAAVDVQGRLFGCYRSAFDPRADQVVLGDLRQGWFNEPLLAAYAKLDPRRAVPEEGSCDRCDARDGCTIYCPAMGHVLVGDLRGVSALACRLLRVQVEVVREAMEQMRRADQGRRHGVAAPVAAAALALGLTSAAAACDSRPAPAGVCAVQVERGPAPGVCAVYREAGSGPGVCAYRPDAGPDGLVARPDVAGGLCPPSLPDQFVPPAGLCTYQPDMTIVPGQCPALPDEGITPGLCPVPGIC